MIRILVDSSSDFTSEERKEKNLSYVPLNLHFEDENYQDGLDITKNEFYNKLISGDVFPKTSQPSPEAFLKEFEDAKEKGDEVICILLSSSISGTFQSANLAKNMCGYDNIHLIDSLSATYVINIMVDYAIKLRDEGKKAHEIVKSIEDLRDRTTIYISLDTLEYLYKGGRLNRATATIGEIANLKPSVTVTRAGSVSMFKKSLGKNKAMTTLIKSIEDNKPDTNFPIYSLYTHGTANCEKFEEKLKNVGYNIEARGQIGATIGAHLGPDIYGVAYISKEKNPL